MATTTHPIIGRVFLLAMTLTLCGQCGAQCPWILPLNISEHAQAGYMVYNFSKNEIASFQTFDDNLTIQAGNDRDVFMIEDGVLYLNKTISLDGADAEDMCAFMQTNIMAFNLKLQCTGRVTTNAPDSTIIVTLTDDFPPEITVDSNYSLNITERSHPATANLESSGIHKHDRDCGTGNLQFELRDIDGLDNAYFSISGDVLTANVELDYERNQSYLLNVSLISNLQSGGVSRTSLTEVEVRVMDVDDQPPVFGEDEYHVTFDEEQDPATWVQTSPHLNAVDGDIGINATILYGIVHTVPHLNITIDPATGELKLLEKLDRETTASYRVTVKAAQADDPLMKVTTTLTVLVSDVNDHRPTFTPDVINVTVREDALVMQIVALVSATDDDAGDHGRLTYRITPGSLSNNAFELATEPSGITALVVKRTGFLKGESVVAIEIEAVEGSLLAMGSDACSSCVLTVNVHVLSINSTDPNSPNTSSYVILPVPVPKLISDVTGLERKLKGILGATVSVEGIDPIGDVPQLGSSVSIKSQVLSTADLDNLIANHAHALYTAFAPVRSPTSQGCDATHFGQDCSHTCSCAEANTADCDDKDGYCTCKYGWTGRHCDVDVGECQSINFCTGVSNEFCSNLPGNYTCLCDVGFHRPMISSLCQACNATTYGQDCASTCSCAVANTAECNDKSGVCVCKHGWTGINCATDVDECRTTNNCTGNNELCYNLPGSYKCLCDVGFYRTDPTSACKEPSFRTTLSVASTTTTKRPIPFACESGPNAVVDYIYTYDPAQYIHCTSDGKAYIETCPVGQLWNQGVRKCSAPSHLVG